MGEKKPISKRTFAMPSWKWQCSSIRMEFADAERIQFVIHPLIVFSDFEFAREFIHEFVTCLGPANHSAIDDVNILITVLVQESSHIL
jgi:hypothetical protein